MIVSEMLPELLFSVGGGMQDFSKDDLGLLGSGVVSGDKDLLGHPHSQQSHDQHHHTGSQPIHLHPSGSGSVGLVSGIDEIKLTHIPDLLEPADGSKLEDSERDLYPWHTGTNIGSRFLRSSDDPLISGGTNDNPHDNELSVPTVSQSMCPSPTTPPPKHRHPSVVLSPELRETTLSPLPTPPKANATIQQQQKRTNGGAAPRARRKGPLKLRFHHQALPQEYLDHYEATQNSLQRKESAQHSQSSRPARQNKQQTAQQTRKAMMERQAAQEREERANESVRSWLQKILELQKEGVSLAPLKDEPAQMVQSPSQATPPGVADSGVTNQSGSPPKRVVNYTDLPYMGEITLDNSKPRRGRKPKKADICHLIYKNYGTILPGTPNRELGPEKSGAITKGCSKSVASLLERRLTSCDERKSKPSGESEPSEPKDDSPVKGRRKEEPLNLCVRDSGGSVSNGVLGGESFSLSSSEEDPDEVFASSCPTPIITASDICTDQALAANMKLSLPTLQSSSGSTTETPSTADTPPGCMYWSTNPASSSLFAHPISMYYPVAAASGEDSSKTSDEQVRPGRSGRVGAPSSTASSPPISPSGLKAEQQHPMLVPKHISQLMKNDKQSGPSSGNQRSPPAQKRKRSAIFIPPVPAENSSNPATEVSICKFKFTGGAKPCLQEKKILSVDSGGNFRYYSGTGDKSMRGYEFFPRESLQQSSINATSTTGAFLNASGERISCDLPPPSLGLSNDLLQIPEFPTSPQPPGPAGSLAGDPTSPSPSTGSPSIRLHPNTAASERRRRKSRRATQRESLEKTFKEKGFLIQTQQLQSAEGATYCKFRQLRKFTRYLFRSWKDYLPGELQQEQQHAPLQDGELPGMILPPIVTSTRDTPPQVHCVDEGSSLLRTSSTRSSMQMETVDICESPHHRSTPPIVTTHHRLRRSRRTSTASATSQHVHSETLVIDASYHKRSGSLSPVVD
ncbi:uncharacterized protein LOC131288552 [Anopheles ziemanni]|uniref:uncharacterized protein LOC131259318 n=1 Tax=Anopheles coustani TaxID=139045 RepID=UPI00265881F8|nr:uncharacterized protein LOC131259318 [Anopheles coustani]XP_058173676.1 uncharacterized protein LOC131288552 [Anopheles ziemanni]